MLQALMKEQYADNIGNNNFESIKWRFFDIIKQYYTEPKMIIEIWKSMCDLCLFVLLVCVYVCFINYLLFFFYKNKKTPHSAPLYFPHNNFSKHWYRLWPAKLIRKQRETKQRLQKKLSWKI